MRLAFRAADLNQDQVEQCRDLAEFLLQLCLKKQSTDLRGVLLSSTPFETLKFSDFQHSTFNVVGYESSTGIDLPRMALAVHFLVEKYVDIVNSGFWGKEPAYKASAPSVPNAITEIDLSILLRQVDLIQSGDVISGDDEIAA